MSIPRRALLTLAALFIVVPALGQVTLAPTFVYVEHPATYATVVLTNTSDQVQEVFVEFDFGYPTADAGGHRFLEYGDTEAEARFSLSPWVRSFPERVRIAPRHRQMVRLMIRPPRDTAEGMYWTRMIVTSREERPSGAERGAVVDFEFRQIIPVVFDHRAGGTSVRVDDLVVSTDERKVEIIAVLDRTGDVPFFGTVDLRLLDGTGSEIARRSTRAETYFRSGTYFTLEGVPPGTYVAEVTVRSERPDVRSGDVPPIRPVSERFAVRVPGPLSLGPQ